MRDSCGSGGVIGWLAADGTKLYRVRFFYFFWHVLCCYCSSLLVHFVSFFFCFHALVRALLCTCSSDIFLSSRPRTGLATMYILLGMVDARTVYLKNTHTNTRDIFHVQLTASWIGDHIG